MLCLEAVSGVYTKMGCIRLSGGLVLLSHYVQRWHVGRLKAVFLKRFQVILLQNSSDYAHFAGVVHH